MFTIRIGNRRIKLLNWLIFLLAVALIIYVLGSLVFFIPIFKKTYNYKIQKENYEITQKNIFKNAWFKCNTKEIYEVKASDDLIKEKIYSDLKNDGFKERKGVLVRKTKSFGTCKNKRKNYEKYHKQNNFIFKLNGKDNIKVKYGDEYNDEYVALGKNYKVDINSDLNIRQTGNYVISYTINMNNLYKERLYRKVSVIDNEKPVIELLGEEEFVLEYNTSYSEPGYTAKDNYDGDITKKVRVKNSVNTKKTGTYKITYTVYDSNGNKDVKKRKVIVNEDIGKVANEKPNIEVKDGITYVNGIIVVNKEYGLPNDYDPKVNNEALENLKVMQADAGILGFSIPLISGYRSYKTQEALYNKYVKKDGEETANTYSAKPGFSEHQTGLSFDIGSVSRSFDGTTEAKWIEENAHLYGFIVRYPKGKTDITGYIYEPWHVRYLGKEIASKVKQSGLTLEEYLGLK